MEDHARLVTASKFKAQGSRHNLPVPAAVGAIAGDEPVREVGTMTVHLNELVTWLLKLGVDTVALAYTGTYWIPVFEVQEQHGLKTWLVDARQMKYVPGRKSEVRDCQWPQTLISLVLLRVVTHQCDTLIREQASWSPLKQNAPLQMAPMELQPRRCSS